MNDDLPEAIEEVAPDWRPRGEIDVERALRGLSRLASRFQQVRDQAKEWRSDIDSWERAQVEKISERATAVVAALEAWGLEQRRVTGTATFSFPSGTIETRKASARVVVEDDAALLEWCSESMPSAVKVVRSVLVSVIRKECETTDDGRFVTPDGEIVPGCKLVTPPNHVASAIVKLASQIEIPAVSGA